MFIDIELEETKMNLRKLPIKKFLTPGKDLYDLQNELEEYSNNEWLFEYMSTQEFAEFLAEEYDVYIREVIKYEIEHSAKPGHGRVLSS